MINTVFDLMQETARRLTGRGNVAVRINTGGRPVKATGRYVLATTRNNRFGIPIITLYEPQTAEQKIDSFLHECAHVKYHSDQLGNMEDLELAEIPTDPALKATLGRWEYEADSTARRWMNYAKSQVETWQQNDFESLLGAVSSARRRNIRWPPNFNFWKRKRPNCKTN